MAARSASAASFDGNAWPHARPLPCRTWTCDSRSSGKSPPLTWSRYRLSLQLRPGHIGPYGAGPAKLILARSPLKAGQIERHTSYCWPVGGWHVPAIALTASRGATPAALARKIDSPRPSTTWPPKGRRFASIRSKISRPMGMARSHPPALARKTWWGGKSSMSCGPPREVPN